MGCCQSVINCKYSNDVEEISTRTNSIAINAFQMCKKGEIFQENIEMQLRLVSQFTPSEEDSYEEGDESDEEDYGNFMARCQSLSYNVEIGELHERDKFNWIINKTNQRGSTGGLEDKKIKQLDFNFKLNHIKQVVSIDFVMTSTCRLKWRFTAFLGHVRIRNYPRDNNFMTKNYVSAI